MLKRAKVDSVYTNNDPYLPFNRRRWRWDRCLPLVVILTMVSAAVVMLPFVAWLVR